MIKKSSILCILTITLILCVTAIVCGEAIVSPTPDYDGNIFYVVQSNDSCLSISLRMGVSMDEIRALNDLDEDCSLIAGTKLLLGIYSTPTPTPGPSPTPTPITPTPTPFNGYANICVFLFEDENENGTADAIEHGLSEGTVSLVKRNGSEDFSGTTGPDGKLCFTDVPEGEYNLSVSPLDTYQPTTNMNYPIVLNAGESVTVNFGAGTVSAEEVTETPTGGLQNPLMAIIGGGMILIGIAVAVIFTVKRNRE